MTREAICNCTCFCSSLILWLALPVPWCQWDKWQSVYTASCIPLVSFVHCHFSQSPGFATYTYKLLGCRECISHNYWGPPNTAGKCMLSIINLVVDVCPLVVYFTIGNYCFVSTLFFHLCYSNCAWRKLVW